MYRAAIRSIFSELARQGCLVVVDTFSVKEAKTKVLIEKLKPLESQRILVISESIEKNLELSARNLPYVNIASVSEIDPLALVSNDKVVITVDAVKKVEEWLQ